MKKVIKGRLYDTDTAKRIGGIDFGRPDDRLYYSWKALYVKKTGEYFLFADGGPGTQYAEAAEFTPLTLDEAMEWAEENLTADEYETAFGLPDEGGEETEVRAWVSPVARAKLEAEKSRTGETVKEIIERLLMGL